MTRLRKPAGPSSQPRHLAESHFARLYKEHSRDILAYALRRVAAPEDAGDVVAETFLAAWRRFDDLPDGPDARLWLYGTARHVLANQRRGQLRRANLGARLQAELSVTSVTDIAVAEGDFDVRAAMSRLDEPDRELLWLIGWEELTPSEAAQVLGITAVAARGRLHRARRRLLRLLEAGEAEELTGIHKLETEEKA